MTKLMHQDDIFLNASWKKSLVVAITMPNFDKTKSQFYNFGITKRRCNKIWRSYCNVVREKGKVNTFVLGRPFSFLL